MKRILICFLTIGAMAACKNGNDKNKEKGNKAATEKNVQSSTGTAENSDGWQYLFDGTNADGWRAYNGEELPEGWVVENGTLKSLGQGGDIGGDIVYSEEEFDEFELYLEWKISPGGNSGIFYHVVEDEKYAASYFTAPEYQIIDQLGFPQELEPWQSIGADYGMYEPEYNEENLKEAGKWNTSRIRFTNEKVTYWLNGEKTVEFEPWGEYWETRKNEGKWKDFPDYGESGAGLIGLQDHGSYTWFKNIKIKKL